MASVDVVDVRGTFCERKAIAFGFVD